MKHYEISINTNSVGYEYISAVFISAGIQTFVTEDPSDLDLIMSQKNVPVDYIDESLLNKDREVVVMRAYVALNTQGESMRAAVEEGISRLKEQPLELGSLDVLIKIVDDSDWAENWKEFFHPIEIGEGFVVKPSWESYTGTGRTIIEIDPESSFGSGQHETTFLCLEQLDKIDMEGKTVLDMGCGSGILGIGAALRGAASVFGVDIDENSVKIAEKNFGVNGIEKSRFSLYCGNILGDSQLAAELSARKYDVIAANIVADVICEMLPFFRAAAAECGTIICSGIIEPKKDIIEEKLISSGFAIKETKTLRDWVCFTAVKRLEK